MGAWAIRKAVNEMTAPNDTQSDSEDTNEANDVTTGTPTTRDLRVVKEPGSEKAAAIIEAALQYPDGTNGEIADVVETKLGERPDESWVSRVRRDHLADADDVDGEVSVPAADAMRGDLESVGGDETVVDKASSIEARLEQTATEDDVDRLITAVESLAAAIDGLSSEVDGIHGRLDALEGLLSEEMTNDLAARLLESRAEELKREDAEDDVDERTKLTA